MDEIDAKILKILSEKGNATATEVSERVNLSVPAVNKRMWKLQRSGVIQRFTVLTDGKKVGKPIMAFILVVLQSAEANTALLKYIEADNDVLECYAVTGEYDYIIKICASDVEALEDKLLNMKRQKGVVKTHTMFSLMENKCFPAILPEE